MRQVLTVYDCIRENNIKTVLLISLFPLLFIFWMCLLPFLYYLALWIMGGFIVFPYQFFILSSASIFGFVFIWTLIAYRFGPKMIMSFAGAKKIDRSQREYKRLYNIVENTAIMAGLPTPKVYLMEDDALNAFTSGTTPKNASIAVTRGLIENLSPIELQGVIAHEVAHIQSRDVRLHTLIIVGIGIFSLIGHALLSFPSLFLSANKGYGETKEAASGFGTMYIVFLLLGGIFLAFSYLFAPLIHMAISRQREYAADALGAKILHNPNAIADALVKIKKNSFIHLTERQGNMAFICIASPEISQVLAEDTHPPINDRIRRLRSM